MLATLLGVVSAGCGSSLPPLPTTPSAETGFVQAAPSALTGLDEDPPLALTLMPGDVVNLQMISGTESAVLGLTVDERGVLHVPLAGDVDVAGLSLTDAEGRIETAMRPFDQTVRVTIIVAAPNGQRATVIGAVTTPGRHTVVPGMRLADLFALSGGGISEDTDGVSVSMTDVEGARLVRNGQVLPVSLALAITGDPRHNVRLRPGDHLYVPPAVHSLVSVLGEVNAARVMPFRPGLRLTLALAFAGGPTRDADHAEIIVVRGDHAAPQVYVARLDELLEGTGPDPLLAPGDVVYVGASGLSKLRDVMSAIAPLVSVAATTGLGAAVISTNPR